MRYHSQNLNEDRNQNVIGSMFWKGRAWLHGRREIHWEWCFGKHARACHFKLCTRDGEGDDGVLLMVGIPFLFDFYFGMAGLFKSGKQRDWGVAIHGNAFWVYPGNWSNESNSKDPWWLHCHAYFFPWQLEHYRTDVLDAHCRQPVDQPFLSPVVFSDIRGSGKKFIDTYEQRKALQKSVSKTFDYAYTLRSGEVQHRKADVFVDRMEWRARWWPIIPIQKVRTSINVEFDDEVGEGTGSWKGGCTGCGYDMLSLETPARTLRRMERERKFGR
jgi:hypothetical protein